MNGQRSMAEDTIKCPRCNEDIPLTEALSRRIREGLAREYEARERQREEEYRRREEELRKKAGDVDRLVRERLAAERTRLEADARRRAGEEAALKIEALRQEAGETKKRLAEANRKELEYIRERRALEEEKKGFELKVARAVEEERRKIREEAEASFVEAHRLKDLDKDKKIRDMQRIIADLKRKAEQGPVQAQGEVMELDLEAALRARFPLDEVLPVPKGIRGADIVQKVRTGTGRDCGSIIWELKRTKAWNNDWLTKLKDDQREVRADLAVIATETLPRGTTSFDLIDGVWVTGYHLAPNLAAALRASLVQVARIRQSAVGREEKMEAIYRYLSGPEFRQKVEAILESFRTMREELEREKAAVMRLWAKREKQIERVLLNTVKMYGDLEGIIGAALPPIRALELEEGGEKDCEPGRADTGDGETGETKEGLF